MIKTVKTMDFKWLLITIVVIQLGIWLPPFLMGTDEIVETPKMAAALVAVKEVPEALMSEVAPPVMSEIEKSSPDPVNDEVNSVEEETLNTDQPTPLIYADWFLLNWQTILTILTILPVVIARWRDVLGGKPVKSNPETE